MAEKDIEKKSSESAPPDPEFGGLVLSSNEARRAVHALISVGAGTRQPVAPDPYAKQLADRLLARRINGGASPAREAEPELCPTCNTVDSSVCSDAFHLRACSGARGAVDDAAVERGARTLFYDEQRQGATWEGASEGVRRIYREQARAVLEAASRSPLPDDVQRNSYTADREPGLHVKGLPATEDQ